MKVGPTLLALGLCAAFGARGQGISSGVGSPLAGLALPHPGAAMHDGSWDRTGGNHDFISVEPGQTVTLFDHTGAGIVHRFWVTISPRSEPTIHREAILRMYWDGEKDPSVESPIGDFFGVGFGEQKDFASLPLNENSGGYNCYWPMPFHRSAHWTLTNLSKKRIDSFYYNIDYTGLDNLPKDTRHFHAQWHRENPTDPKQNYTILDAVGDGHFVGTALFMQDRHGRDLGFLEGDEMVYADGALAVNGTGTEDYFSSGWYFDHGTYSAPYHGVVIKDEALGRVSAYRWHIEDAMPFHKNIRVTIEHGNQNDHEADYSSVAYWYQTEPHKPFPPLGTDDATYLPFVPPPPFKIAGVIEGESLIGSAVVTDGTASEQLTSTFQGNWSGDSHLMWDPKTAGATLTIQVPAPADGTYDMTGYLTKAHDYGIVQFSHDDVPFSQPIDLYHDGVVPTGSIRIGTVTLKRGDNPIVVKVIGHNPKSPGFFAGIDALKLTPAP